MSSSIIRDENVWIGGMQNNALVEMECGGGAAFMGLLVMPIMVVLLKLNY